MDLYVSANTESCAARFLRHNRGMTWARGSVGLVWLAALIGAAVVVFVIPDQGLRVMLPPVLLVFLLFGAFVLQLTVQQPGAMRRVVASAGGAVVLLLIASAIVHWLPLGAAAPLAVASQVWA